MELLEQILESISIVIDMVGISILLVGFIKGCIMFVRIEYKQKTFEAGISKIQKLRCKVGIYILVALDFLIAADIINSVVNQELNDLYELGIIVVLRTTIGYFLDKEIREIKQESS